MSWPAIDHSLLSPSGHMSKRAHKAALKRETARLFPDGFPQSQRSQVSKRETLLRQAAQLRDLASRGMHPRSYVRHALQLEAQAALEES